MPDNFSGGGGCGMLKDSQLGNTGFKAIFEAATGSDHAGANGDFSSLLRGALSMNWFRESGVWQTMFCLELSINTTFLRSSIEQDTSRPLQAAAALSTALSVCHVMASFTLTCSLGLPSECVPGLVTCLAESPEGLIKLCFGPSTLCDSGMRAALNTLVTAVRPHGCVKESIMLALSGNTPLDHVNMHKYLADLQGRAGAPPAPLPPLRLLLPTATKVTPCAT
eukprot:gene4074-4413_t